MRSVRSEARRSGSTQSNCEICEIFFLGGFLLWVGMATMSVREIKVEIEIEFEIGMN